MLFLDNFHDVEILIPKPARTRDHPHKHRQLPQFENNYKVGKLDGHPSAEQYSASEFNHFVSFSSSKNENAFLMWHSSKLFGGCTSSLHLFAITLRARVQSLI